MWPTGRTPYPPPDDGELPKETEAKDTSPENFEQETLLRQKNTVKAVDRVAPDRLDRTRIDVESTPQHDYGRVTLLVGTSTAGKTSIVNALRAQGHDFFETGFDLIRNRRCCEHLKEICPGQCDRLFEILKGDTEDNTNQKFLLAYLTGKYPYTTGVSPEQQAEATALIEEVKAEDTRWLAALSEQEREDFNQLMDPIRHLKEVELDNAIQLARSGRNALFDILDINDVASEKLTGHGVPIDKVLVYCPFSMLAERMLKRTQQAEARGDLLDKREGLFPFKQFAKLYTPVTEHETHLEILKRNFVIQTFNENFDLSQVFDKAMEGLSDEARKGATDAHLQAFLDKLGFTGDKQEIKIGPKFKGYDIILNSGKHQAEACASTLLRQRVQQAATPILSEENPRQAAVENGLLSCTHPPGTTFSIMQRMKEWNIPGVSIATIHKGTIEWSKGYGELEKPGALCQAASLSKTVTALTILSLIQQCQQATEKNRPSGLVEGKTIDLDTDVRTILGEDLWRVLDPDNKTEGKEHKVTIRRLLSHTAGISTSDFPGYPRPNVIDKEIVQLEATLKEQMEGLNTEGALPEHIKQTQERIRYLRGVREQAQFENLPTYEDILNGREPANSEPIRVVSTPGECWSYSGGGYTLLEKVIEILTDKPFEEVVSERVLRKLDMNDSTFSPEESRQINGNGEDGNALPGQWYEYPELAAAGLWSTASDLAKLAIGIQRSIAGEKNCILNPELASEMITPASETEPATKGLDSGEGILGLGVFINKTEDTTFFSHSGYNNGVTCFMIANNHGQGVVVMTNSEAGPMLYKEIIPSIANVYSWRDFNSVKMFAPLFKSEEFDLSNADKLIETFSGEYRYDKHTVVISESENRVFITIDGDKVELIPISEKTGYCRRLLPISSFTKSDFKPFAPGPIDIVRFEENAETGTKNLELYDTPHTRIGPGL